MCKGKDKITKSLEDQRLIQFLMGLNDAYGQARGIVLVMNPLPNMNFACSLLLQDKNQKEVYANAQFNVDFASFMATVQGKHPNAQMMNDFASFMAT